MENDIPTLDTSLPAPATPATGDVNAVAAATTAAQTAARKKLYALFNNISASIFKLISDCTDYHTAIQVLDVAYIKPTSVIER